jgi:hypothetical protein
LLTELQDQTAIRLWKVADPATSQRQWLLCDEQRADGQKYDRNDIFVHNTLLASIDRQRPEGADGPTTAGQIQTRPVMPQAVCQGKQ